VEDKRWRTEELLCGESIPAFGLYRPYQVETRARAWRIVKALGNCFIALFHPIVRRLTSWGG
jgi:hypothetical protein